MVGKFGGTMAWNDLRQDFRLHKLRGPIARGTFLNLRTDQPARDAHYTGATLARFVEGKGLTCDAPPAGFVQSGLAGDAQHVPEGLYAYYKSA